eukprot:GHVU01007131.1.p1 GENE.GHVU01007131.1~~GHVU01007131.1.p1  ORF type:complete len:109 (-),score=3.81 GHVU01007131.1:122-448(-)
MPPATITLSPMRRQEPFWRLLLKGMAKSSISIDGRLHRDRTLIDSADCQLPRRNELMYMRVDITSKQVDKDLVVVAATASTRDTTGQEAPRDSGLQGGWHGDNYDISL